jgi:hypothetical protein
MIRRALGTLLLAATLATTPLQAAPSSLKDLREPSPRPPAGIVTTLAQDWPGAEEVTVPDLEALIAHYAYLSDTVRTDQILFTDDTYRPIAIYTLPDTAPERKGWDALDPNTRRSRMGKVASRVWTEVARTAKRDGIPMSAINYNVGMADMIQEGMARYAPYAPYLEQLAALHHLDPRMALLGVQESQFRTHARSSARCYGAYQISDPIARQLGMVIPPSKTKIAARASMVDERYHPILAAEGAFTVLLAESLVTGSLLDGIESYHSGMGNKARMRAYSYQFPYATLEPVDVRAFFARYVPEAQALPPPEEFIDDSTPTDSLSQLSWRIREGAAVGTKSTYRAASRRYLPAFLGLASVATVPETEPYRGERIELAYLDDPASYERNWKRHHTTSPYRTTKKGTIRRGETALTAKDLMQFFADEKEFQQHNPHIPLNASIPEGTDVFFPIGASGRIYDAFPEVAIGFPKIYDGFVKDALPVRFDPVDHDYMRAVTAPRLAGQYHLVTAETAKTFNETFKKLAEDHPTMFRRYMAYASSVDLALYDARRFPYYAQLLKSSAKATTEEGVTGGSGF